VQIMDLSMNNHFYFNCFVAFVSDIFPQKIVQVMNDIPHYVNFIVRTYLYVSACKSFKD
jgi:hypothetical protein